MQMQLLMDDKVGHRMMNRKSQNNENLTERNYTDELKNCVAVWD